MFKSLNDYIVFDTPRFFLDKQFTATGFSKLLDYETKKEIGTKVDAAITQDNTKYKSKNGESVSNLYEKLTFKVIGKTITVPIGAIIEPIDPVGTVYGEYRNQLSIKCSDIKIISAPAAPKV